MIYFSCSLNPSTLVEGSRKISDSAIVLSKLSGRMAEIGCASAGLGEAVMRVAIRFDSALKCLSVIDEERLTDADRDKICSALKQIESSIIVIDEIGDQVAKLAEYAEQNAMRANQQRCSFVVIRSDHDFEELHLTSLKALDAINQVAEFSGFIGGKLQDWVVTDVKGVQKHTKMTG